MQSRKLLLIGASLGALMNIGAAGAAKARQSSDGPLSIAPIANDSMMFASFRYYPF
jgi:hypothetical protein